tara:strand:- start:537 stop:914 length:378 start_codon:yes stop_codon:yes gene_type:complete
MANPKLMTAHAKYDFAVDGGAVSTIVPVNSAIIPDNAVIVRCYSVVTTAMTSGGSATLALTCGGVTCKAATAFDNGAFDDEDVTEHTVVDKTTSSTGIQFVIATAALTAGVVDVYVEYYLLAESA